MSIALTTGPPGSGKSFYAVREIVAALERGQYVATNIELSEGWPLKVARLNFIRRLIPGRVAKTAALYESRVFITPDLDELFRVRLHGKGEERGVMVLDEAHNWMNARTWDQDEGSGAPSSASKKGEAVRRRLAIVRFFSQHRKLGWRVLLITQDEANIDRQVRTLFEYHVKLKNARNFKIAGIRIFPCNIFIAVWLWNDKSKSRVKTQSYLLNKKVARLYDTMALSHGMEDSELEPIMLPRPLASKVPAPAESEAHRATLSPSGEAPGVIARGGSGDAGYADATVSERNPSFAGSAPAFPPAPSLPPAPPQRSIPPQ